jgi:transaldolase
MDCEELSDSLLELGMSLDNLVPKLEDEGVEKFNQPFDKLMATLAKRSSHLAKAS